MTAEKRNLIETLKTQIYTLEKELDNFGDFLRLLKDSEDVKFLNSLADVMKEYIKKMEDEILCIQRGRNGKR